MNRIIEAYWRLTGVKAVVARSAVATVAFAILCAIVFAVMEGTARALGLFGVNELIIEFVAAVEAMFCMLVFFGLLMESALF